MEYVCSSAVLNFGENYKYIKMYIDLFIQMKIVVKFLRLSGAPI